MIVAAAGYDRLVTNWLKKLLGKDDEPTAARQQGDPTVLDRPGDPRGGQQSDDYRHADPRDIVEERGTAMAGPGGAPQEELSVEERRAADRETD